MMDGHLHHQGTRVSSSGSKCNAQCGPTMGCFALETGNKMPSV